jgi:hypothetical protein
MNEWVLIGTCKQLVGSTRIGISCSFVSTLESEVHLRVRMLYLSCQCNAGTAFLSVNETKLPSHDEDQARCQEWNLSYDLSGQSLHLYLLLTCDLKSVEDSERTSQSNSKHRWILTVKFIGWISRKVRSRGGGLKIVKNLLNHFWNLAEDLLTIVVLTVWLSVCSAQSVKKNLRVKDGRGSGDVTLIRTSHLLEFHRMTECETVLTGQQDTPALYPVKRAFFCLKWLCEGKGRIRKQDAPRNLLKHTTYVEFFLFFSKTKRGRGVKGRVDKSMGIVTYITEVFPKLNLQSPYADSQYF